ncbi:MAG TPA: hypothetical protein VFW19_08865 [Allosphingosinicella sp.]|nr:hypothetical protein [Allosphingosinicella sp.]
MIAALLLAAGPALAAPPQTPVDLFKAACTAGSVSLPKGSAAPIAYEKLPHGAREALGQTLAAPGDDRNLPGAPKSADVSNPILEVGPGQAVYLLAPATSGQAQGRFAHACAIIWKGEHFAEGRAAILPADIDAQQPPSQTPKTNSLGLAFVGTKAGGLFLSVTTLRDWTVLKSVPEADSQFPGAD